jgi:hypothetical protein
MHQITRSGPLLLLICAFALEGCVSTEATIGEASLRSSRETGAHTRYLEGSVDEVWFHMQRAFTDLRIPLQSQEPPSSRRGLLVSRSFAAAPEDFNCGARPTGEHPLSRSVQAQITATLQEYSPSRTEASFSTSAIAETAEPTLRSRKEECVSRGTLEARILQQAARRMVR